MSQVPGGSTADNNVGFGTLTIEVLDASFTAALGAYQYNDYEIANMAAAGHAKLVVIREYLRDILAHRVGQGMDEHSVTYGTAGEATVVYKFNGLAPFASAADFVADIIAETSLTSSDVQVVTP